ncbi:DUF4407 domain-containing protein [Kitasatospora sp. NPDC001664]
MTTDRTVPGDGPEQVPGDVPEEPLAEGTPAEGTSAGEVSEEVPAEGAPVQGVPGEGVPAAEPFEPVPVAGPVLVVRPAGPSGAVGRRIRKVAGVDEDVLDWVPEERRKYTWMGLVILNTGLFAGLSLLSAMNRFLGAPWWVLLPPALLWAWVIVCLDGMMIAGSHGKTGVGRWRALLPRLALSVLLGLFIAEPLILRVFEPAIHQEVKEYRISTVGGYEELLHRCNPVDRERSTSGDCRDNPVSVPDTRVAAKQRQADAQEARNRLATEVDRLKQLMQTQQNLAHDECTGTSRQGTTGRAGIGLNCLQDRKELEETTALHARQQGLLDQAEQELTGHSGETGAAVRTYTEALNREITKAVEEKKATQGRIDLLDEVAALDRLGERNWVVRMTEWLARLVLIVLDCLPVLVKLMSGTTAYDRRLERQLAADEVLHDARKDLEEQLGMSDARIRLSQLRYHERQRMAALDQADMDKQAMEEAEVDAAIEELAAKFRRQARVTEDTDDLRWEAARY